MLWFSYFCLWEQQHNNRNGKGTMPGRGRRAWQMHEGFYGNPDTLCTGQALGEPHTSIRKAAGESQAAQNTDQAYSVSIATG